MLKILLFGSGGKMGEVVKRAVKCTKDFEVVAGIDACSSVEKADVPTFSSIWDCDIEADILIDFSTAEAVPAAVDYAVSKRLPAIICTTALSKETLFKIDEAAKVIPILRSANMSIGINLLLGLLKKCAATLSDAGFDIEIVEKHHRRKIDAPSGTALMLADAVNEASDGKYKYVYDRASVREKRSENEIGIMSVRGGTIAGEHDVIFAGNDEIVEFNHRALSNDVFAQGALLAAKFLADKKPGLYSMEDIFNKI